MSRELSLSDEIHRLLNKKGYKYVKYIGRGSFGKVHMIRDVKTNVAFAFKLVSNSLDNEIKNYFEKEVKNYIHLEKHERIVQYIDSIDECRGIILEYCGEINLQELIDKDKPKGNEVLYVRIIKQILEGLNFIHNKGIVHKDIKPNNIFIVDDEYNIKIGDFGISAVINYSHPYSHMSTLGAEFYRPPEYNCGNDEAFLNSRKYDIWSLGIVVLEMFYDLKSVNWNRFRVQECHDDELNKVLNQKHYSDELTDFIRQCVTLDKDRRPYSNEIIKHKLFQKFTPTTLVIHLDRVVCSAIDFTNIDDKIDFIIKEFFKSQELQTFDCTMCKFTKYQLTKLSVSLNQITTIRFNRCQFDEDLLNELFRSIRNDTSVKVVVLQDCDISNQGLEVILNKLKVLNKEISLNLENNKLNDGCLGIIQNNCGGLSNIYNLYLQNNDISPHIQEQILLYARKQCLAINIKF